MMAKGFCYHFLCCVVDKIMLLVLVDNKKLSFVLSFELVLSSTCTIAKLKL